VAKFGKRLLRSMRIDLRRTAQVSLFRRPVHFLHIGKNAGTQIGRVIAQVNAAQRDIQLVKHGHGTILAALPEDEPYFFSIRDPLGRFKSGFYSRKRMGRPRLNNPWSPHEARIFETFEHATDLAEALFDPGPLGRQAMAAMMTVGHMGAGQLDWFKKGGDIFALRPPVWIIRQDRLAEDLEHLLRRLGLSVPVTLSDDPAAAHSNDYTGIPPLSPKAEENLRRWHAPDFAFIDQCNLWLEEQRSGQPTGRA
jgi:hypothetical protein